MLARRVSVFRTLAFPQFLNSLAPFNLTQSQMVVFSVAWALSWIRKIHFSFFAGPVVTVRAEALGMAR